MKKALSILLIFILVLTLFTACGSDEPAAPAANNSPAAAPANDADNADEADDAGGDTEAEMAAFIEAADALTAQQTELVDFLNDLMDQGYEVDAEYMEKINALSDAISTVNAQIDNGDLEALTSEELAMITEQVVEYGVAIATLQGILEGLAE